ncbi:phosphonate C-P lyase system protein PhnL [Taklimakanibacter albus]|uniref:Phosphonate C-P lyase system protein PhnL n=1 Tax=Taklimakanibacter albus TaxID=2800327 RepID=A0ACC5R898_9HYPH|nr:phosphonate C-P lyase system protein PhnL [Aestuariivirga sp. YIM B02566]MBK1868889.1 phosphonate C-P lyase system protein PhnL [Aestuariivirga sp. YIM B02566]
MRTILKIRNLAKQFRLHLQGGVRIPVFDDLHLELAEGEALAVTGPSGKGKSSLLKIIYGTYKAGQGEILVRHDDSWVDLAQAEPRQVLEARRRTIGYVTQFLRVIPRVPTLDIVSEPLLERGIAPELARERAALLLERLNIPERLWSLSPMTFSGGEQQRVNIARGFAAHYPILLLDEPTASLDQENKARVLKMIDEARDQGSAIIGIFHDASDRKAVCTREFDLTRAA